MPTIAKSIAYAASSLAVLLTTESHSVLVPQIVWRSKHARTSPPMTCVRLAGEWQRDKVDSICFWLNKTTFVCLESNGQKHVIFPKSSSSPLQPVCPHDGFSPDITAPYASASCYIHWDSLISSLSGRW